MHGSAPVHSKTMSKPSGSDSSFKKVCTVDLAFWTISSRAALIGGTLPLTPEAPGAVGSRGGRQYVLSAQPHSRANSSRFESMSMAQTLRAPKAFASAQARRPIVPTPKTRTALPLAKGGCDADGEALVCCGHRPTRDPAWRRTDSGSARDANVRGNESGILLDQGQPYLRTKDTILTGESRKPGG